MIFRPGNAVLKGTQGSGKSMLLNLLRPEIRLAYHKVGQTFPVAEKSRDFISAGINLTLSGALDVGQRPVGDIEVETSMFPLLFADFLNYYVVLDLLRSLEMIGNNPIVFDGIVDPTKFDDFARHLAQDECWYSNLDEVETFNELEVALKQRVTDYRSFHQFNSELSERVITSKTRIGWPMAAAFDALNATSTIRDGVQLFVRIDQLERLHRSDIIRKDLGIRYRQVVNKVLGQRDSRVSYRIGTRSYAWEDDLTVYGTQDQLEVLRDFRVVDLESQLRRQEDRSTWIFPGFAEDAFKRRLEFAGLDVRDCDNLIRRVFGTPPTPEDAAKMYAGTAKAISILRIDDDWHPDWKPFLENLFEVNPLHAILANAWAMQRGGSRNDIGRRSNPPPSDSPWEVEWWKKERVRQCLIQIAARNAQRLRWSGDDSIIAISSPNISVFLSVCHEIWDAFSRVQQSLPDDEKQDPLQTSISPEVQALGIHTASKDWFKKIAEQPHGHDRQRFVEVLGRKIRQWLLEDIAMSYPGEVGFSLEEEDLRNYPKMKRFLEDASDYGDLYDSEHRTKKKNRKQRIKWYLSPILSPHFQIPEAHPKEPRYTLPGEVTIWAEEAGLDTSGFPPRAAISSNSIDPDQLTLFDKNQLAE